MSAIVRGVSVGKCKKPRLALATSGLVPMQDASRSRVNFNCLGTFCIRSCLHVALSPPMLPFHCGLFECDLMSG